MAYSNTVSLGYSNNGTKNAEREKQKKKKKKAVY